jgi:LmbE family N-acetylglucosaminyl deacetylase
LFAQGYLPHKVKEVWTWGADDPNYLTDITETFETKIKALRCHKSQIGEQDFPETYEWLKEMAITAAKDQSFKLAEEFRRTEIWM